MTPETLGLLGSLGLGVCVGEREAECRLFSVRLVGLLCCSLFVLFLEAVDLACVCVSGSVCDYSLDLCVSGIPEGKQEFGV